MTIGEINAHNEFSVPSPVLPFSPSPPLPFSPSYRHPVAPSIAGLL